MSKIPCTFTFFSNKHQKGVHSWIDIKIIILLTGGGVGKGGTQHSSFLWGGWLYGKGTLFHLHF